jgi:TPP-dependent indolepyruvate ferredoxin oxidoreductase alpha subunit
MFLAILTFVMLGLVLALKYGSVTRIVHLNQRLREAEGKVKRNEERLRIQRTERGLAEREETQLVRQQLALEEEARKLEAEMNELRDANMDILQQLAKRRGAQQGAPQG